MSAPISDLYDTDNQTGKKQKRRNKKRTQHSQTGSN